MEVFVLGGIYKQDNEAIGLNKGTKLPYCILFLIIMSNWLLQLYIFWCGCPYCVNQGFLKHNVRHLVVEKWVWLESNEIQVLCLFRLKDGGAPFCEILKTPSLSLLILVFILIFRMASVTA